jgi:outer membrane protein, heavy metal efflux system
MRALPAAVLAALMLLFACPASAEPPPSAAPKPAPRAALDLPTVLSRVRERSPARKISKQRIAEAEARLVGADVFPRENPNLQVAAGPQFSADGAETTVKLDVGLTQAIDLGGGLSARGDAARAGVEKAKAEADASTRDIERVAGKAFARALWAERRLAFAREIESIALENAKTTGRRKQAGDATLLQLNAANGSLARARSEVKVTEAERARALGELRFLLGLEPGAPVELRGELSDIRPPPLRTAGDWLRKRPDLRALEAEVAQARAEEDLADALAFPTLTFGALYEFEDGNQHTIQGVLGLTLPIFERSQGLGAEAGARARRLETELEQKRREARNDLATTTEVFSHQKAAAEAFAELGKESVKQNLELGKKAFEAGEIGLVELLTLQRELVATQSEQLDRELATALAALDTRFASGGAP